MRDVKIGQTVTHRRREGTFVVLDRHPDPASWWLQDAQTGRIGLRDYAHERELTLVADPFRVVDMVTLAGSDGRRVQVKHRAGDWVVTEDVQLVHAPSGRYLTLGPQGRSKPWSLTELKRLADKLGPLVVADAAQMTPEQSAWIREACRQMVAV